MKFASGYRLINLGISLNVAGNGSSKHSEKTFFQTGNLEVNGVILESNNIRVLIISVDTLFIGHHLRSKLETYFSGRIDPIELFISATHTHSAPMLDFDKPELGVPNIYYFHSVLNQIIELCEELLNNENKSEAFFSAVHYDSNIGISRRKKRFIGEGRDHILEMNKTFNLPNYKEKVSQPTTLIKISNIYGDSAIIWNQACHPVSIPPSFGHSPGYIGVGRELLRKQLGFETPVIFLQGFSGDIRPNSTRKIKKFSDLIKRVLFGKQFAIFDSNQYFTWLSLLQNEILSQITLLVNANERESDNLKLTRELKQWSDFQIDSELSNRFLSKHTIAFDSFKIIGFSGEVLSKISSLLSKDNADIVLPVGCIDATFGYLPDSESIKLGGYEVNGYWPYFNIKNISNESYNEIIRWICK